jgi:hypothetical protein
MGVIFFNIFLSILLVAIPVWYLENKDNYPGEYYFAIDLFSNESIYWGNIYCYASLIILWIISLTNQPHKLDEYQLKQYKYIYERYGVLIYYSSIYTLFINALNSFLFGMAQVALVSQRPQWSTWLGYSGRLFEIAPWVFLGLQIGITKKITTKGLVVIVLILLNFSLASSRSGLIYFLYFYLFILAYQMNNNYKSQIMLFTLISFFGLLSVMLGQYYRSGDYLDAFTEINSRLFLNNLSLYLSFTDHDKIFNILTKDEPWIFLSQFFSIFQYERELPSSLRLLEFWGATAAPDDRGHYAGYTYGWLGITHGLFGWWGLIAIILILKSTFLTVNKLYSRPSLLNYTLFIFSGMMLYEFFNNLGLDSFLEKLSKGLIFSIFFVFIIQFMSFNTSLYKAFKSSINQPLN